MTTAYKLRNDTKLSQGLVNLIPLKIIAYTLLI